MNTSSLRIKPSDGSFSRTSINLTAYFPYGDKKVIEELLSDYMNSEQFLHDYLKNVIAKIETIHDQYILRSLIIYIQASRLEEKRKMKWLRLICDVVKEVEAEFVLDSI